jgi:tRNA pseudouridine13 synthase
MKLRQAPDDFQVEELTDVRPGERGPFACYLLSKTGWTTPDALFAVRRRWQLDARRVSYGGLKDRHARTVQHFTALHGPRRNLTHQGVSVRYLGQLDAPFTSADIRANRFRIVVRDLTADARANAEAALAEVGRTGLPNYFDDQRFGSVTTGREFVARHLVAGRFEEALKLALTAPYEFDRATERQDKATLRASWGDWPACKAKLSRSHARSLVDYLVSHPTDFRGAIARLRPELGGLYLSAYQSDLWNRVLAHWLRGHVPPDDLRPVALRLGEVPVPVRLPEGVRAELETLRLPLPSARLEMDPAATWARPLEAVLAEEGLTLPELRIRGLRQPFFSKGDRAAWCRPAGLSAEPGADENRPGRFKLTLGFELPRGCYATMLVKRITTLTPPRS